MLLLHELVVNSGCPGWKPKGRVHCNRLASGVTSGGLTAGFMLSSMEPGILASCTSDHMAAPCAVPALFGQLVQKLPGHLAFSCTVLTGQLVALLAAFFMLAL